jgi:glycosyltransferase involved in cell wall biosynthesis
VIFGIDGRPANAEHRVGIGNFCGELLRALLSIKGDASFRIYLDAEPRDGLPGADDAAEFRVLPRRAAWTQRILAAELRRDPPDAFLATGLQVPLWGPCPSVATVHDLAYRTFGHCFPWRMRTRCRLEAACVFRRANHLLAVSQSTKEELCRLYGMDESRVTVVHEGVSPRFAPMTPSERADAIRARYTLPARYVLYVGVLQPRKNLLRLIDAFKHIRGSRPDLPHHLVIAGKEGWLHGPILQAAREPAVKDFVQLLGYVPEEDLPCLMAQADALALVSLWEGFGLPALEAMACGTAVLASNTSALPEVVGDAGVLVDPCDTDAIGRALERILVDDSFRRSLEAKGLEQAARFTWERTAQAVLGVLKNVATKG